MPKTFPAGGWRLRRCRLYHCTDNRRTTIPINACVKISTQRISVYTTRKLWRRTNHKGTLHASTIAVRHGFTRKIWDTQTATARRKSCMRKYIDGYAITWRCDVVRYTRTTIRTYKITYPRLGQRFCHRRRHKKMFTRYAHICNVRETRQFRTEANTKTEHFQKKKEKKAVTKKNHNGV